MSPTQSEFTKTPSQLTMTERLESPSGQETTLNVSPERLLPETPLPTAGGFGPVLKNPRFLLLWGGQIFSQLADKFYLILMIALIVSYYQQPDQSISRWVSAIMIANTIPAILFGSLAGVYIDRWSKNRFSYLEFFARSLGSISAFGFMVIRR